MQNNRIFVNEMTNQYHKDIVDMLLKCGKDGMQVSSISQQIYNERGDFFSSEAAYDSIYRSVRGYLWRQSRLRQSPFRRLRWGRYALKQDFAVQLDFVLEMFSDDDFVESEEKHRPMPIQLTLFD